VGQDVAEHGAQVFDGVGPKRACAARDRDVELGGVEEQLDAVAGLQALDPPDSIEVLLVLLVLLRDQRGRQETGDRRERQRECGETDGGNGCPPEVEGRADQPPRAAWMAEPRAE
jgi:hypothetical protein